MGQSSSKAKKAAAGAGKDAVEVEAVKEVENKAPNENGETKAKTEAIEEPKVNGEAKVTDEATEKAKAEADEKAKAEAEEKARLVFA